MMAVYEYTAKDEGGNEFCGTYDNVDNVAVLRDELDKMSCVLVKCRKAKKQTKWGKIKQSEIVTFAYKFSGMYSAGLSVPKCLETLEQQADNQAFKYVITDIKESIESGLSLEKAFRKHNNLFSDFFLGMLEAGESGGKLAEALQMSATYLEKQAELKRKVKSAFTYPVVVGTICFVVVVCLLIFVVPVFSKLYRQLRVPLPGPTQVLVGISFMAREWWWAILVAAIIAAVLLRRLLRSSRVKEKWDVFKLNMPVFAKINRMVVVSHFIRTFAMLASVGVSLIKALDAASIVAHNHRLTEISKELQQAIEAGNPVANSLKKYDIFPPMITQLAFSGEEVGELPEMLNKGVDFLDKDIERTINALIMKLEPALTVIMGIIVGFILMAVYLPMFDYMRHLK